jgi:predicted TIM-barrel enzyme
MTEALAQRRAGLPTRQCAKIAGGEAVVVGGAGTGLSAQCEEAGGIDLVVICNSGEQRPSNEPTTPETP